MFRWILLLYSWGQSVGHPDGQNYALWRGPDFLAQLNQPINPANPVIVSGQVTNYASLIITMNAAIIGGFSVSVQWFIDSTMAIQTAIQAWTLAPTQTLNVILPCLGNYVKVSVTSPYGPGGVFPIAIYPTNSQVQAPKYTSIGNLIAGNVAVIAIGATDVLPLPAIASGRGHFFFRDETLSGKFSVGVISLKQDGTSDHTLAAQNPLNNTLYGDVNCPDIPMGLYIQNLDGAATHTITYSFHIDGR